MERQCVYEMYSGPKPALIGSSALTDHTLRVMLTLVSPSTGPSAQLNQYRQLYSVVRQMPIEVLYRVL